MLFPLMYCAYARWETAITVVNPRRACGFVCLSVTLNLTSRVFVRLTKDTTYLTGNEGQKFRTVFSETAPLQS